MSIKNQSELAPKNRQSWLMQFKQLSIKYALQLKKKQPKPPQKTKLHKELQIMKQ